MPRRTESDPLTAKIGARLRSLRLERNLSISELGEATEISKGHLSSIERGLAAITVQTVVRLAKGLGLPPFYLLASPSDDARDDIVELIRQLPAAELGRLRRELTKSAKLAEKAAVKAAKAQDARSRV